MKIRIGRRVVHGMVRDLQAAGSREIGGVLFAEQLDEGHFRILEATRQRSDGTPSSFCREGTQARGDILALHHRYGDRPQRFNYLGEWHSHPGSPLFPSPRDHSKMVELLADQAGAASFLVLMLARLSPTGALEISALAYLATGQQLPCEVELETENGTVMTDVRGAMFISYRRSPCRPVGDAEAVRIRDALRDRGVPTWRDLDDLGPTPTEDALAETLSSEELAGAVMLISREVKESPVIRHVEAPAILDRFRRGDGFIFKPVLIGLPYGQADCVLGRPGGFQEVSRFNIDRIAGEELSIDDARRIANDVLKQRLAAIRHRDPDRPFSVGLYSRLSPSSRGCVVCHDFTSYFDGRDTSSGAYATIEVALADSAAALAATGNRVRISARGNASLPLGVLFGAIYSPLAFDLDWLQATPGAGEQTWSLECDPSNVRPAIHVTKGDPSSEDLVLAVSVSADVEQAAAEYLDTASLAPRAILSVALPEGPLQRGQTISPEEGRRIALDAINATRDLRTELRMKRANLHLFLACPLGLAVLLGQNLNTFGDCIAYEHFPDRTPAYEPTHRFQPSNFTYHG